VQHRGARGDGQGLFAGLWGAGVLSASAVEALAVAPPSCVNAAVFFLRPLRCGFFLGAAFFCFGAEASSGACFLTPPAFASGDFVVSSDGPGREAA